MSKESERDVEVGVEVPWQQIGKEALSGLVQEFVLREGTDYGQNTYSIDQKIEHVMSQLRSNKAKVVYDATSDSCSLVTTV
ncbi:MAG: YheU family protein [Bdellovibrionaceae bacterium]|jgi:uncharacterized protein|nr:YheU family protein [Pseudobdellovibrionaceae bacterium]